MGARLSSRTARHATRILLKQTWQSLDNVLRVSSGFWANLLNILLTKRAPKELSRRNAFEWVERAVETKDSQNFPGSKGLQRFARQGSGPNQQRPCV